MAPTVTTPWTTDLAVNQALRDVDVPLTVFDVLEFTGKATLVSPAEVSRVEVCHG